MDSAKVIRLADRAGLNNRYNSHLMLLNFAALKEYGELVKSEAVKVCNQVTIYEGDDNPEKTWAAAIEKMELP